MPIVPDDAAFVARVLRLPVQDIPDLAKSGTIPGLSPDGFTFGPFERFIFDRLKAARERLDAKGATPGTDTETIAYAARALHCTPAVARSMARRKQLPGVGRIGKKWLVHRPTFDAYVRGKLEDRNSPIVNARVAAREAEASAAEREAEEAAKLRAELRGRGRKPSYLQRGQRRGFDEWLQGFRAEVREKIRKA